jgi:hypothetical protein
MTRTALNLYLSGSAPVDFSTDGSGGFNNPLLRAMTKNGFRLAKFKDAQVHVYINHKSEPSKRASKDLTVFRVLIRTEPVSVFPAQYKARIENRYDLIITTGLPEVEHKKFINLPHPYKKMNNPNFPLQSNCDNLGSNLDADPGLHDLAQWLNRKIFINLIAANKVSSTQESNYALRRKFAKVSVKNNLIIFGGLWNDSLIKKIHHRLGVGLHALRNGTIPNLMSLYGGLHSKFENYMGSPEDKQAIMRESKFALVIENSDTYVSEKLFDALIAGSIPVYFGPDLSNYGITETNLVIRHDEALSELKSRLENMSVTEISIRLSTIQKFVHSTKFKTEWEANVVYSKMAAKISECQERK